MIAEIYPIQRLPRRFRAFDYLVPDGMEVRRGSFVRISLRGRPSLGVVARTKDVVEDGITAKPIDAVLPQSIPEREMDAYESIAADIVQSPSLLHAAVPLPPKREINSHETSVTGRELKIASSDAAGVTDAVRFLKSHGTCFVRVPDLRFAAAVISGYRRNGGAIRVAAPNVRDAKLIHRALGGELLTGDETNNARFAAWSTFRVAKDGLLIGTRVVSLLEHQDGSTLFLVRSGHENLKQPDRNPRYSARSVAREWAARGSHIVFLDVMPNPNDLFHFKDAVLCPRIDPQPEIVEMKAAGNLDASVPSPQLLERIEEVIPVGRILLSFNRKNPERKHGTASMAKELQKLFPDVSVAVCEKGSPPSDARILIATRHYLENVFDPFRPEPFALVAELDADAAFADKTILATEHALTTSAEWQAVARAGKAGFLLQTATPDLFRKAFADPLAAVSEDLESRRAYGFPPFGRIAVVDGVETPLADGNIPDTLRNAPDSVIIDTSVFS